MQRTHAVLFKNRAVNSFQPDGKDVSDFSARLARVHANCYESFPFIGGLLLLALATNLTAITSPLALVLLACRIGQSLIHLVSTSGLAVQVRFALFVAQFLIAAWWTIQFAQTFAA